MPSTPGGLHPAGGPAASGTYANIAIEAALTIRMVFHLPLRQTEHRVASVSADGAYDTKSVYEAAQEKGDGRAARMVERG